MTFTCDADGNPTPTFSWTKDGSVVNKTSRITVNADKKQLTITNVSRGVDSGEYICLATNDVNKHYFGSTGHLWQIHQNFLLRLY